jgi:hypothetical protein
MTHFLRLAAASPVHGLRKFISPLLANPKKSEPSQSPHTPDVDEPWSGHDRAEALERLEL